VTQQQRQHKNKARTSWVLGCGGRAVPSQCTVEAVSPCRCPPSAPPPPPRPQSTNKPGESFGEAQWKSSACCKLRRSVAALCRACCCGASGAVVYTDNVDVGRKKVKRTDILLEPAQAGSGLTPTLSLSLRPWPVLGCQTQILRNFAYNVSPPTGCPGLPAGFSNADMREEVRRPAQPLIAATIKSFARGTPPDTPVRRVMERGQAGASGGGGEGKWALS